MALFGEYIKYYSLFNYKSNKTMKIEIFFYFHLIFRCKIHFARVMQIGLQYELWKSIKSHIFSVRNLIFHSSRHFVPRF